MTTKRVISLLKNVMWVGRATPFLVGLAVILALMFGVATASLAGTGAGGDLQSGHEEHGQRHKSACGKCGWPQSDCRQQLFRTGC